MKKETLEEAAEKLILEYELGNTGKIDIEDAKEMLIGFVKWQQERMYSEEEVRLAYQKGEEDSYLKGGQTKEMEDEFIESLKNKLNK